MRAPNWIATDAGCVENGQYVLTIKVHRWHPAFWLVVLGVLLSWRRQRV